MNLSKLCAKTEDINGIITVTAEDIDKHNKKGITITGNKGRLKPDEIKKLIEESKYYELKDKLERHKKQLYYEIDDLCCNISDNIKKSDFKLTDNDKNFVTNDVNVIIKWLKEKKYYEHDEKDLEDILERLKKRYGTLILRGTNENANVM